MEWIVKIEASGEEEDQRPQRIRVVFNPQQELLNFFGEVKMKNNKWTVFSQDDHEMEITLEQIQEKMKTVVVEMRKRLKAYKNLDEGFGVLKWVALEEQD